MIQPTAFRVTPQHRLQAVARLLGAPSDLSQARRFISDAPAQGVDLDLLWGFGPPPEHPPAGAGGDAPSRRIAPSRPRAGGFAASSMAQVAMIVPGAGRVGMLFAGPPLGRVGREPDAGLVAVIEAACAGVRDHPRHAIALVQTLVEAPQAWLRSAIVATGFLSVGRLLYLRRSNEPPRRPALPLNGAWPGGVRLVSAGSLGDVETQNRVLVECLDRTYQGTLDCPELCGLRETADILESHRACGRHDPDLWWLAMRDGRAVGCALFSAYPDQGSIELVYLGLAPEVRGLGLGARLAKFALDRLAHLPMERVACAVDERNAPARRLYDRLGFSRFDTREAYVRRP